MAEVIETENRPETAPDGAAGKTPSTRLLDLVAGWSEFVQSEEGRHVDHAVSVEDLTQLYQDAGQAAFDMPDDDPQEEVRQVRAFMEEHVLPLLLRTA